MLDEVAGTLVFTGERSRIGYRLNRMAMSLTDAANRSAFVADETGYLRGMALNDAEIDMVRQRDWKAIVAESPHVALSPERNAYWLAAATVLSGPDDAIRAATAEHRMDDDVLVSAATDLGYIKADVTTGGPINFLNQYEQAKSQNVDRPWDMWRKQVGAG